MISCSEAVRRLWDYLENDLDAADRARVDEHLAFCRKCCGEAEFAEALRSFLASAAPPEMPTEVKVRLNGFLDSLGQEVK